MPPALDACPGVLILHPARDGLVARIRLPGGYAGAVRWRDLARLSATFGDGAVDLTARGNVQLRGLRAADADALAAGAFAAGLLPSAEHDRARNLTASPLSGLGGRPALRGLAAALDAALLAAPELAALPGRFLFALDDGTGGASLASSDLGLRSAGGRPSAGAISDGPPEGGFDLFVAGRQAGVRVRADEAVPAVLAAARAALAAGVGDSVTRIAALPGGGQSVAAALGGTLGVPAAPDTRLPLGLAPGARSPGAAVTAGDDGRTGEPGDAGEAVVAAARLGRLTGEQIEVIAELVAAGEVVRLGGAGRLVIPLGARPAGGLAGAGPVSGPGRAGAVGVSPAGAALARLRDAGLIVAAADPMGDVTACSGAACDRSLADVRAAAGPVADYPRVHWAGCSRKCGCPPDAEPVVALGATRYRMPGEGAA
ncbi:MAG TPA: precorrin-3B synthase [Streptosporangiaceae bacterium]